MAETSTAARRPIYAPYTSAESPVVPDYWVQRYEHEAARYWDRFYTRNADRFFKDRHYLQRARRHWQLYGGCGGAGSSPTPGRLKLHAIGNKHYLLILRRRRRNQRRRRRNQRRRRRNQRRRRRNQRRRRWNRKIF